MVVIVLFLILLSGALQAQVVVEYAVETNPAVLTDKQKSEIPNKVYMAIHEERVIVRPMWDPPRTTYQLYDPAQQKVYYCDLSNESAVQDDFLPDSSVVLTNEAPKIIGKLPCNQALWISGRDTFPIYYTDAFGIQFCPVAIVPGFAFRFSRRIQGVLVTYTAIRYYFEKVPAAMFSTADRTLANKERPVGDRRWAFNIGKKAPKVFGRALSGMKIKPRYYAGKTLVVDLNTMSDDNSSLLFWQDLNWFSTLVQAYADNDQVRFICIFKEDESTLRRFIPYAGLKYPILFDGYFYTDFLKLKELPATLVIHPNGKIVEMVIGHTPEAEFRLKRAIDLASSGGLKPLGLD
jgi:hypothetical protein